ncbi:MAG: sodium:alanine symporter family protein [Parachlamydiaceae bacterium]|nr:sodium:alanine symporter family protein [Parachlamydiaceae bacterium]
MGDFSIEAIADYILFLSCLFILFGSIFISFKMRFIQLRFVPTLWRLLRQSFSGDKEATDNNTISPSRALFTAMSTTLGIGTIVGPVIAIRWGGPGALVGFLLTAFFGSAATFAEVGLSIKYRKRSESGEIQGGPMQYLKQILSPAAAKWYAVFGCIVMTAWSAAQANQLAAIMDSPQLGSFRVPTMVSGVCIAVLVFGILVGGIKRVSSFSAKLVPVMFTLYLGSSLWILLSNMDQLGSIMTLIIESAFSPYAMSSGALVGGVVSALRWGVYKGTQVTEAGVGTQTIPHSFAETNDPVAQSMLAMLSTYSAGLISFISGCVALVTNTWQDPELPMGASMVAASFQMYFSYWGIVIVAISTFLFALGTILGNSFNGSQCFNYLANKKYLKGYYLATVSVIFFGTIADAKLVWSVIDVALACLVVPHMFALMLYTHKAPETLLPPVAVPVTLRGSQTP